MKAAALALALAACAGPRAGGDAPPKEEPRHYAFQVLDLRDAALNARDLDGAAVTYAPSAEVVDVETGAVVLRGRDAIRAAHARFLEACPDARIDVLDRAYGERGRFVTDRERVRCGRAPPAEALVKYEIVEGWIVRVWHARSPAFAP